MNNFSVDIDEQYRKLLNSILGGRLRNGDKFAGRLDKFDEEYLQLTNSRGKPVFILRSEVVAIWGL